MIFGNLSENFSFPCFMAHFQREMRVVFCIHPYSLLPNLISTFFYIHYVIRFICNLPNQNQNTSIQPIAFHSFTFKFLLTIMSFGLFNNASNQPVPNQINQKLNDPNNNNFKHNHNNNNTGFYLNISQPNQHITSKFASHPYLPKVKYTPIHPIAIHTNLIHPLFIYNNNKVLLITMSFGLFNQNTNQSDTNHPNQSYHYNNHNHHLNNNNNGFTLNTYQSNQVFTSKFPQNSSLSMKQIIIVLIYYVVFLPVIQSTNDLLVNTLKYYDTQIIPLVEPFLRSRPISKDNHKNWNEVKHILQDLTFFYSPQKINDDNNNNNALQTYQSQPTTSNSTNNYTYNHNKNNHNIAMNNFSNSNASNQAMQNQIQSFQSFQFHSASNSKSNIVVLWQRK